MFVTEEFIWRKDHFVCHITEEKNISSIMEKGLIPTNGERCKFVGDDRTGVFFLDGIMDVRTWITALYEQKNYEKLKLLRFNLKNLKWFIDDSNNYAPGFYLLHKINPEKISYLDIRNKKNMNIPLTKLFDLEFLFNIEDNFENFENFETGKSISVEDCTMSWKPLCQYKKVRKI